MRVQELGALDRMMIPCSVDAALHVANWAWQAVSSHVALAAGGRHSWNPRPEC